uniref:Peptidyl-tRNA hydrolase 1 homolog n=1 Tax=Scophthalmus maximus TaxID=52904 RepID=A0A8D3B2F3_SCOMX
QCSSWDVVGLGNLGMEGTRHSVGMAVLGALAARLDAAERWRGDKHVSGEVIVVSEAQHAHVVLLRPRLPMNVNGVSVVKAAGKYGVRPEDVVLVHDELDKPLGKISIKHGGSARSVELPGENIVEKCLKCTKKHNNETEDAMMRLRVGIGRPAGKSSVERHVLGRFSSEERKVLDSVLVQSVDLLLSQLALQDDARQDAQSPASPAGGRRAAQEREEEDKRKPVNMEKQALH